MNYEDTVCVTTCAETLERLSHAKSALFSVNCSISILNKIAKSDKRFGLISCADNVGINPDLARKIHALVLNDYLRAKERIVQDIQDTMKTYLRTVGM